MNTPYTINQQSAQGDLLIRRVDAFPSDLVEIASEMGEHIVAHSETGHHHVLMNVGSFADIHLFRQDSGKPEDILTLFLDVQQGEADIVHRRPFDTHETLRVPPGKWEIRRQREHVAEGWRRVSD